MLCQWSSVHPHAHVVIFVASMLVPKCWAPAMARLGTKRLDPFVLHWPCAALVSRSALVTVLH